MKEHITGGVQIFFGRGEAGHEAIILWCFVILLIFPNFLGFQVLSCSVACEDIQFITWISNLDIRFISNKHALFHLWWKVNLYNHHKVSKYYEHDSRRLFSNIFHTNICVPKLFSFKITILACHTTSLMFHIILSY